MMEFSQEEGLRFHPNDSELLKFLLRFIAEKDLRDNGFITVLDIYQREPCVNYGIGRHCGGEKDGLRYFLSPLHHKKEQGGERFCRIVGGNKKIGNWKLLNKGKEVVLNYQNLVIKGMKKSLCFENKSKSCEGKWLMKEYSFSGESLKKLTKSKLKNYCICAIRKSNRKSCYGFGQIQDMEETPVSVGNHVMEESPVSIGNPAMEEIQKGDGTQESAKAKVKERMEKAFLDGVMKQDNPILRWVLKRMKEVQNELCEMSPPNWRQEILETVDIDILSEVQLDIFPQ
ncbi:NAC domain-containing protein 2-like [Solanum stenotomum]|uniref:NAC domain-containing protein 2-like n=1 Tax=Solanum stenotomum TaxID=172797 RepID=UPI0020D107E0|nr:NAC domain-containing protein 2-like [Solanum stenotomum]